MTTCGIPATTELIVVLTTPFITTRQHIYHLSLVNYLSDDT